MEELNMSRRPRREFTEEFKLQMVKLYNSGKPTSEIVKEYDLTRSAFMRWVEKYNKTGSFKACDNRTEEEKDGLSTLFSTIVFPCTPRRFLCYFYVNKTSQGKSLNFPLLLA